MSDGPGPDHFLAAAEFVLMLRQKGLSDTRVLRAMEQVPRVPFVADALFGLADDDVALPIGCGQSILAPSLTGAMVEALDVESHHRVLHIGTGSGYAAALLARLGGHVISVERWRTLADSAHIRLRSLGYETVDVIFGDGLQGYPPRMPFDRILSTCALPELLPSLIGQLAPGGIIVAPIGAGGERDVLRVETGSTGVATRVVTRAFVAPAVAGTARRL
jgi:protein-L-isoaspartate(D-aspartate) O-methyltransferase